MRHALLALTVLAALAVMADEAAAAPDARLQGAWSMKGRVTRAEGVRGEHRGQRVTRAWNFAPRCGRGACSAVTLTRERSRHQRQTLTLHRSGPGRYTGKGSFYVRLRCGSKTYNRGGIAYTRIQLKVTRTTTVQSTRFATAIRATYTNPRRVNRTPCPGSLGRDAGTYSGRLSSPVPAPPTAQFASSVNPVTGVASFRDTSHGANGVAIAAWSWNFGDPGSGAANASTDRNPTHRYAASGAYSVALTVTDANGLTGTVTRPVVVAAPTAPG